jgi:hypothetical protein
MPPDSGFKAVLLAIGLMVVMNGILFFRSYIRPSNGKASYNERQKYIAGAMDRAATACLVAGFVTPQTRLSDLMLNVDNDTRSMVILLIWILVAMGLHLLGAVIVARVKD